MIDKTNKHPESSHNDSIEYTQYQTKDNQKKEINSSKVTKDLHLYKKKIGYQVENSTKIQNSKNAQLKEIIQQTMEDIEAGTKEIVMRKSELNNNNGEHLKNSKTGDNFENNDLSETNPIIDSRPKSKLSPHCKQLIAAMGPYLMIFSAGLSAGFSATLLPQLKHEESAILTNENSPSWIASIAALPTAPGCLAGGWLMERLGRRNNLCVLSIPFFVGWILIASAPNLTLMLMGRFLNGLSVGLLITSMSVFISETSDPKLRGTFLAFLAFFLALGIFFSHLIGTWMSWQWTATISSIFPLLSTGFLIFVPESPVWLFSKGKTKDAFKSFYWLRGYDNDVETELKALFEKFKSVNTSPSQPWRERLKIYNTAIFFKPLFIMITIYLTCQFSGMPTITFYSVDILEIVVGEGINHHLWMLAIDFLRVITTLVTCLASKQCPRRALCFISGSLTTMSMAGLSLFLYFYNDYMPDKFIAIPLCFLSSYIVGINIGLLPMTWMIVGEIFPTRFRSIGAGLASAIGYFSTFVVVKTAPEMILKLSPVITFMFYSVVSLVGTIILYFILPETKGKSLLEIELEFKKNKVRSSS